MNWHRQISKICWQDHVRNSEISVLTGLVTVLFREKVEGTERNGRTDGRTDGRDRTLNVNSLRRTALKYTRQIVDAAIALTTAWRAGRPVLRHFLKKSVIDVKGCLHYLLPPPRPDSLHRLKARSHSARSAARRAASGYAPKVEKHGFRMLRSHRAR